MKTWLLLLVFGCRLGAAEPVDYQKFANITQWYWRDDLASALGSLEHCGPKYDVHLDSRPSSMARALTIRVSLAGRDIFSWRGHPYSVFAIAGDKLFLADFNPGAQGGAIVAVDLLTGTKLWSASLRGHRPVGHSAYWNRMIVTASEQAIYVWGKEAIGTYLEIKDAATGKTVGHRIFSPEQK